MARRRTGTLKYRAKPGWCAHVTVTVDGEAVKKWYPLGTHHKAAAKRKLARLVAELAVGKVPSSSEGTRGDTVREYAEAAFKQREASGITSVYDERGYFKNYVDAEIGHLALTDVRPSHIRAVLEAAVAKGLSKNTVVHLRALLNRIFKAAWQDELISENPVARVAMPSIRETKKERVILTDEEIASYLGCADVDLELRLMSLVARVEGGMRTSDVNRWDWSMIDRAHFAECFIPRSKTGKPQRLEVPYVVSPFLRARWEARGRPESGPVFPVRRGVRAGEFKATRGVSYAASLRRDLLRAGVKRHDCTRGVGEKPVKKGEACCPNMAHDPLFSETATTLPVDFHSFRRAFNTALAEAGVNVQRAMHLAAHSDEKVHMRYVMSTAAMRQIPEAAVPRLLGAGLPQKKLPVSFASPDPPFSSSHLRDLNSRPTVYEGKADGVGPVPGGVNESHVHVRPRESPQEFLLPVSFEPTWLDVVCKLGPALARAALDLPPDVLKELVKPALNERPQLAKAIRATDGPVTRRRSARTT